jgi:uncharacterized integral membrane protein
MILGFVIMAMIAGAAVCIALFLMSAPLSLILLAYPVTGSVVLVSALALRDTRGRHWLRGEKKTLRSRVTARFRARQPPG